MQQYTDAQLIKSIKKLFSQEVGHVQHEHIVTEIPALDERIRGGEFIVDITLTKTQFGIDASVQLEGSYSFHCDLCLAESVHSLTLEFQRTFKKSVAPEDMETAEMIQPDYTIDLSRLIQEEIALEQPITLRCSPDCKGLCPTCGKNKNQESCECDKSL